MTAKRLFFILRTRGANWDRERDMEDQQGWAEHKAFMEQLAGEGFIQMGGPLDGTPNTLLLAHAQSEDEVRLKLAEDIWTRNDLLRVERVAPWTLKYRPWLAK